MIKLSEVEEIGEINAGKLEQAGIHTREQLLTAGGTAKGRRQIADASGLSEEQLLVWINKADLARINGIDQSLYQVLARAGVGSVADLSHMLPDELFNKLNRVKAEERLSLSLPNQNEVTEWVMQAQELPRLVHF